MSIQSEAERIIGEVSAQQALIAQISAALDGKAGGGGGSGVGNTELEDALITRTVSGEYSNDRVTKIASNMFYDCRGLTSVDFPNVETIEASAFGRCTGLRTLNFPKCKTLDGSVFASCNGATSANFPVLTTIGSDFNSCTALENVYMPLLESIGNQGFYFCSKIAKLDFSNLKSIGTHGFNQCSRLVTLIIRSQTMCTLANTNAFLNTPIAQGTGYVYFLSALVDQYKAAANWSTYANQIRAIEDYPEICG